MTLYDMGGLVRFDLNPTNRLLQPLNRKAHRRRLFAPSLMFEITFLHRGGLIFAKAIIIVLHQSSVKL